MKIDVAEVRKCLKAFDFSTLFREQLGWDKHQATLDIPAESNTTRLSAVAQKRGFVAYVCWCGSECPPWKVREGDSEDATATPDKIPDRPTRLKIDHQVTKSSREHLVIYADKATGQQVWHWVRREPGKPLASRDHRFDAAQSGDPLIQRLNQIAISIDEEESITVVDVAGRARGAFDVDKVTKKFYERFKAEHAAFLKFIKGIKAEADLQWYTSLMLNRLMFVYFIQKKGFLDGDTNYLQNRMKLVCEAKGKDKFLTFYSYFLLRLFHDGLGKSPEDRKLNRDLEKLLGKVPYLNGGFFEVHQLEERNAEIDIPDKAFEKLFAFFDEFRWHLDERPLRATNEINPDVVGYIFEKYINQKQMGAYYTKEDITEYISKNTIIPYLFDAAEKKCPIAFKPDSFLWRLLRDNPDRYIYAAVRHGVVDEQGNVIPLPKAIEAGVKNVSKRDDWNKAADDDFALPTETWREHVARRTRCLELREKLSKGEVHAVNDLITLNLDIWQFARDAIVNSEGPELLRAFWQAIGNVTVLDPTCGSGAFLFAALRILESLYSDCLERMERFVEDLHADIPLPAPGGKSNSPLPLPKGEGRGEGRRAKAEKFSDFKTVLAQIAKHPNERYFILKSLIISNLFGVDIMEEAVEICKLRLFLKLVAQVETVEQIEPLPDIDFNIRAGNTLVGYVSLAQVRESQKGKLGFAAEDVKRIEEDALAVEKAFQQFRAQQTKHGGKVTAKDKHELRRRLGKLELQLDLFLAAEYGVAEDNYKSKAAFTDAFRKWKANHEPFHWFVEFYGILLGGGFDVVFGNPPYVEIPKTLGREMLRRMYRTSLERWSRDEDLYTLVVERSFQILTAAGRFGMILPLSLAFSTKRPFQELRLFSLEQRGSWWWSHFDRIPSALFGNDVRTRCTIALYGPSACSISTRSTTSLRRWTAEQREVLFPALDYASFSASLNLVSGVPKVSSQIQADALSALLMKNSPLGTALGDSVPFSTLAAAAPRFPQPCVFVGGTAYNWFPVWRDIPMTTDTHNEPSLPARTAAFRFRNEETANIVFALLASALGYWWWAVASDGFNLKKWLLGRFPLSLDVLSDKGRRELASLGAELRKELKKHYVYKDNKGRIGNFFLPACYELTARIDSAIARYVPELSDELFEDLRSFNASFSRAATPDEDDE